MTAFSDLVARGNVNGWYKRPSGSDGYPPKPGTRVDWVLSQPVQDMLEQGKRLRWANAGTIGNGSHLQKHGDHTAHSAGKLRGIVYAKDTALPKGGKDALLWLCKQPNYDTTWIDFFNVDDWQYNYAGVKVGPSSDTHLHVSVRRGSELLRVPLFDDIADVIAGTFGKHPKAFDRLGFIDGATLVKLQNDKRIWLAGRGKRTWITSPGELNEVQAYMSGRGMQDGIITVTSLTGSVV